MTAGEGVGMDRKPDWQHFEWTEIVSPELFRERFQGKLDDDQYWAAELLFLNYGSQCSFRFCNLLWLGAQKGNVSQVLTYLGGYWDKWLETARDEDHRYQIFERTTGVHQQLLFPELFRSYGDPAENTGAGLDLDRYRPPPMLRS
jgi:hypothetical protein